MRNADNRNEQNSPFFEINDAIIACAFAKFAFVVAFEGFIIRKISIFQFYNMYNFSNKVTNNRQIKQDKAM